MTDTFADYDPTALPAPVLAYLDRDKDPAGAGLFAPDARVHDDGHEYVGKDAIREWIATVSTEYEYTKTRLGQKVSDPDRVALLIRLDGNFPGGTATLQYRFSLRDDLICNLTIAA